ncbi:MAG: PD40 domain-containing protein [Prolixibacteraceae bacterium]|nr:PD40 domain-containing protein [Prolixibacteraceae bacterium]MBN2773224.1 PD40 domain-containing protein [Prolixibacteraceae bacterium]
MRYILTFLPVLFVFTLSAQDYIVKNADNKFKEEQYNKAIELYEKAYENDPESYYIIKRLVLSNQKINNTVDAEKWLSVLVEKDKIVAADLILYTQLLIENGKFDKAREYLNKFNELKPGDSRVAEFSDKLDYIDNIITDSTTFEIKQANINTPGAELGTLFYRNGIIFSSTSLTGSNKDQIYDEDELPFLDMYFAEEITPGNFSEPKPFAPNVKTRFNDGPVAYDPSENLMYITRYAPKEANRGENIDFLLHLQIIIAEEKNGDWEYKEDFFFNSPDFSVAHPCITPDGRIIYFASDMPGGYGGYDIYFCYKTQNNKWSEPYNVGPVVNSKGDEFFPFADKNGKLYFSSNGHPGLGQQDIYISTPENGVYNKIRNLGYPVNSPRDDVAFVLAPGSERGYFSSNRVESLGYYDIFSVKINYIPITIKGFVKDLNSKAILKDAVVKILDVEGKYISQTRSVTDGSFSFVTNKIPTIQLLVEKPGYEPIQKTVGIDFLKEDEELMLEVFLRKN